MHEKEILDLVAAIGAIPDIDEVGRVTLEMLRKLIWFDHGNFFLNDPLTGLFQGTPVLLDTPRESIEPYLRYYIRIDEVHQTYRASNRLIARSTDLLEYEIWTKRSEYYNDFLRYYNTHYLLGFDLKQGQAVFGGLCLHRHKSTVDFVTEDVYLLQLIYPHLLNRLRWHHALEAARRKHWLPQPQQARIASAPPFISLTSRERDIVHLVLSGATNQETAVKLNISVNTVKMHLQNVFTKLGIKKRGQLLAICLAAGDSRWR
ncbi:MAG: helix-turn-helix transcriptional regulator [Eubacteriales bacterium]